MKNRWAYILVIAVALLGAIAFLQPDSPEPVAVTEPEPVAMPKPAEQPRPEPQPPKPHPVKPAPPAASTAIIVPQPVPTRPATTAQARPAPLSKEEQMRAAWQRYWKNAADQFDRQWNRLDHELDPTARSRLIQSMARYVRIDTLQAVEWAMSLTDPQEQHAALEAINQNALTGIGARIEKDETGYPLIRETTIMSAIGSTGLVEPGDYIVGMEDDSGRAISFGEVPLPEIVRNLRGQAGSEIRLQMERISENGEAYTFQVPVQRSLLVMKPPF